MNKKETEEHPLGFFLPEKAKILMLGSFPPPQLRWSMNFYYPNIQNDMWRIMGYLFFDNKNHFLVEGKKAFDEVRVRAFCTERGIALGDTAVEIIRLKDNASDKFLEVVTTFNPADVLSRIPDCKAIVITGQKAMDTLLTVIPAEEPAVGEFTCFGFMGREMKLFRMPSSSRAYPKPVEEKAKSYAGMFHELGML
ncbi:uracil-DNA glycosylase family protein [Massilibacteroides sp.]|uniref:uracil-DNA glycosylase family protein n=1 Tax=Massilibacteroides sp. TaxID=2034766 RepID=UPI00260B7F44|nr:uracil-DNA glycosylase family protein [Massilibacteroides sp.]MDD4515210.1 uracil-DNA glycosylase family protein [Massilibacteroides sp.]